eukprot:403368702
MINIIVQEQKQQNLSFQPQYSPIKQNPSKSQNINRNEQTSNTRNLESNKVFEQINLEEVNTSKLKQVDDYHDNFEQRQMLIKKIKKQQIKQMGLPVKDSQNSNLNQSIELSVQSLNIKDKNQGQIHKRQISEGQSVLNKQNDKNSSRYKPEKIDDQQNLNGTKLQQINEDETYRIIYSSRYNQLLDSTRKRAEINDEQKTQLLGLQSVVYQDKVNQIYSDLKKNSLTNGQLTVSFEKLYGFNSSFQNTESNVIFTKPSSLYINQTPQLVQNKQKFKQNVTYKLNPLQNLKNQRKSSDKLSSILSSNYYENLQINSQPLKHEQPQQYKINFRITSSEQYNCIQNSRSQLVSKLVRFKTAKVDQKSKQSGFVQSNPYKQNNRRGKSMQQHNRNYNNLGESTLSIEKQLRNNLQIAKAQIVQDQKLRHSILSALLNNYNKIDGSNIEQSLQPKFQDFGGQSQSEVTLNEEINGHDFKYYNNSFVNSNINYGKKLQSTIKNQHNPLLKSDQSQQNIYNSFDNGGRKYIKLSKFKQNQSHPIKQFHIEDLNNASDEELTNYLEPLNSNMINLLPKRL